MAHPAQTQATIADALGVNPQEVAPASSQSPVQGQTDKPGGELDLEDIIAGEMGRPRTEPSKNFLTAFLSRLKKKNPGNVIEEVK